MCGKWHSTKTESLFPALEHALRCPQPSPGDAFPLHGGEKVSGKNFAGTPSWSSRDVFIRRREPGVSLCRQKSTSQNLLLKGGGRRWGRGDPRPDKAHDFISQGLPPADYFPTPIQRGGDGQTDVLLRKNNKGKTGRVLFKGLEKPPPQGKINF